LEKRKECPEAFFFREDLFALQRICIYCRSEGPLDPGFKKKKGRRGIEQNRIEALKDLWGLRCQGRRRA